jgi:hypothetical protein
MIAINFEYLYVYQLTQLLSNQAYNIFHVLPVLYYIRMYAISCNVYLCLFHCIVF